MKGLVVYNPKTTKRDKHVAEIISSILRQHGFESKVYDITIRTYPHEKYQDIVSEKPELLITVNLAGFEMLTELNIPSINRIPCRMAHILLSETALGDSVLAHPFNFSMFFYVNTEEQANRLMKKFPELPHVEQMGEVDWKDSSSVERLLGRILNDTRIQQDLS